jgi:hypothetical protein
MKVRLIIAGMATTLALTGSSAALGADSGARAPATSPAVRAQPLPPSLAKADATLARFSKYRVRCRNLGCINSALTDIAGAVRHINRCTSYMRVAQYPGYLYSNGTSEFQTTALDQAEQGDRATKVAVFVC